MPRRYLGRSARVGGGGCGVGGSAGSRGGALRSASLTSRPLAAGSLRRDRSAAVRFSPPPSRGGTLVRAAVRRFRARVRGWGRQRGGRGPLSAPRCGSTWRHFSFLLLYFYPSPLPPAAPESLPLRSMGRETKRCSGSQMERRAVNGSSARNAPRRLNFLPHISAFCCISVSRAMQPGVRRGVA